MITVLSHMGFTDDRVEKAIIYADAQNIEQLLHFLVPNSKGFWEHKFVPEKEIRHLDL